MLYFQVADVSATVKQASAANAKVMMPSTDIPQVGTMAVVADPQGAVFALFKSARG
jgi:predicted enzyme related to lactoylglutathione lyase